MEIIEFCVIPMVSSPVDKAVGFSFRIVRDLPYAVFPGAVSVKEHQSTISLSVAFMLGVKKKGVRNWLDDIITPTRIFEDQLKLLRETFDCLRQSKLSVNLPKSKFCF